MTEPQPAPAGIGDCRVCAYLNAGTSEICYRCARQTIEPLPADRCPTCDQSMEGRGVCGNRICNWPIDDRFFDWNYAIAMRTGVLKDAISAFKYRNKYGWRNIFGRVLVGFLDDKERTFRGFDLIVASPTYLDPGSERRYDHTRDVIRAADLEAEGRWPFDSGDTSAIIKTEKTEPLVGNNWARRKEIAEGELRDALVIPDAAVTRGRSILVYDDVFTDGFTLREVARCLKRDGDAVNVCGVTLTRQPWSA